jgi:RNA polymerase sigma-70 factor (ECF subfamily)
MKVKPGDMEMTACGLPARAFRECQDQVAIQPRRFPSPIPKDSSGRSEPALRVAELFQKCREPLYRYLLSVVGGGAEAEDIAQESFLRLYAHLRTGESLENPRAWLFRVAYNLAIDSRRRKRMDSLDDETGKPIERGDVQSPDPEYLAIENQRRDRIAGAISRLSEQQRQCMTLRTEGFRHREIAEILGVSESTVAENLRRGVLRLTKELYGA